MTRIILLTAILIAAFTVNAFAVDNEIVTTLTIEDFVTIETAGAASHNVVAGDYPDEPGDADTTIDFETSTATVSYSANTAFQIASSTSGQFGTTVLEVSIQDGAGFVAAAGGIAYTGAGGENNVTKDVDFRVTGVNAASLPQSAAGVKTVTLTISAT